MTKRKKPTELNNYGRIIRKAAEVMNDQGWTAGLYQDNGDGTTSYCVRGAMGRAHFGNLMKTYECMDHDKATNAFVRFLIDNGQRTRQDTDMNGLRSVHGWNDRYGPKNKEDVVAWMHKFADWADPQ